MFLIRETITNRVNIEAWPLERYFFKKMSNECRRSIMISFFVELFSRDQPKKNCIILHNECISFSHHEIFFSFEKDNVWLLCVYWMLKFYIIQLFQFDKFIGDSLDRDELI